MSAIGDKIQARFFVNPLPERFRVQYRTYRNDTPGSGENGRLLYSLIISSHCKEQFWLSGSDAIDGTVATLKMDSDLHPIVARLDNWKPRITIRIEGQSYLVEDYIISLASYQSGSATKVLLEV